MTKRLILRLFAVLLLPTILLLSYNYSVNWHIHRLDSGYLVTHAHPFDKGELPVGKLPDHKHNGGQLLFLDQIFQSLTLALIVIFVVEQIRRTQVVTQIVQTHIHTVAGWHPVPQLRGPPRLG